MTMIAMIKDDGLLCLLKHTTRIQIRVSLAHEHHFLPIPDD